MKWATGFIENLIRLTHDQWTWRNEKLHYRRHPGAETPFEYEQIMKNILDKMEMTDPEDLLPEDQFILEVDPEDIMKASPDARQAWLANFETAEAAAKHDKRDRDKFEAESNEDDDESQPHRSRANLPQSQNVFNDGREWRNKIRRKRINRWKNYDFLGKHKVEDYLSDDSDNESQSNPTPTQQNATNPANRNHATRSNKRQATMNKWLGTQKNSTRQRPQNNSTNSSEESNNASREENQQLEQRSSTNNRNINRSRRQTQLTLPLSSEGSQIFKRRRLK